jgi:hypothetical protein
VPGAITKEHDALHSSLLERVDTLIGLRAPGLSPAERSLVSAMTFGIFKAGLTLVLAHEGTDRDQYVAELKKALHGYLAPRVGAGPMTLD